MAKELAHFKNFAKLKDTSVEFNDITVLAGKPGTGKSYVMKFMYCMDAIGLWKIHENHFNFSKNVRIAHNEFNNLKDKSNIDINEYIMDYIKKNTNNNINFLDKKEDFKNILKSVFEDINQISNQFKFNMSNTEIEYRDNSFLNVEINTTDHFSEVIFVETPLILEFKKFMRRDMDRTPYHIESLLNILDTSYASTDKEQDEFINNFIKKSKKIVKGDIKSNGDSFIFNKDNGESYNIVNASSGTKSIGLLQYLVTNKALQKGSVLYWEEPEVHLHPEWQLRMVDLFIELMNAGVKIVFSTHSPFMADYLNALSKREKFQDRISFNVFQEKDGVVNNYILDDDNWNILQSELMDSFEDILWTYL